MGTKRAYKLLTMSERTKIYLLHYAGESKVNIAEEIGCDRSTIYRELARNSCHDWHGRQKYFPNIAQSKTLKRRKRLLKLQKDADLKAYVTQMLQQGWSPEAIAGRLKQAHATTVISHECIYAYIYSDCARDEKLYLHLRKKRRWRKPKLSRSKRHGPIANRTPIEARPAIVATRETFGHWEGDLLLFSQTKSNLITLRERKSRFILAIKNPSKHAKTTAENIIQRFKGNKKALLATVTLDNGGEFAEHQLLAKALKIDVFFCNPYASYEKGTIENGNRELRYALPRDCHIDRYTQVEIDAIANNINHRPMKCLGYQTPVEVMIKEYGNLLKPFVATRP